MECIFQINQIISSLSSSSLAKMQIESRAREEKKRKRMKVSDAKPIFQSFTSYRIYFFALEVSQLTNLLSQLFALRFSSQLEIEHFKFSM
jgi:hypothetical protein